MRVDIQVHKGNRVTWVHLGQHTRVRTAEIQVNTTDIWYIQMLDPGITCVSVSKMCEGCMRNAHITFKTNMQECHFKH